MNTLTPKQIVSELDKYIVGQHDAKRSVAVAVRNRWRRRQLPEEIRKDVSPKNILMIGPTGVGKTEIARRLATLVGAPFIKVEATKYTEVGYHGRDVESMVRDLLDVGLAMVKTELTEQVKEPAERHAEERLLDLLLPDGDRPSSYDDDETKARRQRTRDKLREQLRAGELEDRMVEISVEERPSVVGVLGTAGMEMDVDMQKMFERVLPGSRETRKLSVREARRVLFSQEAEKLIDKDRTTRAAIDLVEQQGIIFIDELDKVAGTDKQSGPDVSRQGVQRDLLPIVEGSTVITRYGPVKTDYVLFIAAGAFHQSKPSDLMPELQGRFPIRVELKDLTKEDFVRILREPQNSLTKQTSALLGTEGLDVRFDDEAVDAMAQIAFDVNRRSQNIGARRLYTILERVFETISFDAPEMHGQRFDVTASYVRQRLAEAVKDEDLSRYIL
jgi:ATP-dependent HslUV protease ATP-binding subunit HslU